MNIFQFVEEVEMGKFLVSATHQNNKVEMVNIYPVVDDVVYPALLMDQNSMEPLIERVENMLSE